MQLTTEQESPSTEYLSDFLYIDTARLAHYYSQLSSHGLITQSKRVSKATSKEADTVGVTAGLVGTRLGEASSEEAVEDLIDPTFSRPQETLDALYSAGYINDRLENAGIGTLFLTKGTISMFDVRMLKKMWSHLGEIFAEQQTKDIKHQGQKIKSKAEAKKEYGNLAPIISELPHSLHGSIVCSDDNVAWFTVKPEYMLVNPEDFAFKHGCDIPGDWHMLGIIDAEPGDALANLLAADSVSSDLENAMRTMILSVRQFFGRPDNRYGVTPILIFRTIRKASNRF